MARAFTERQSRCEVKKGCDGFQQILFPIAGLITRLNETLFVRRVMNSIRKAPAATLCLLHTFESSNPVRKANDRPH